MKVSSLTRNTNPFKYLLETNHYENIDNEDQQQQLSSESFVTTETTTSSNNTISSRDQDIYDSLNKASDSVTNELAVINDDTTEKDYNVYFEKALHGKNKTAGLKIIEEEAISYVATKKTIATNKEINVMTLKQSSKSTGRKNNKLVKVLTSLMTTSSNSSTPTAAPPSYTADKQTPDLNESYLSNTLLPPLPRNSIPHSISLALNSDNINDSASLSKNMAHSVSNFLTSDFERNSNNRRSIRFSKQQQTNKIDQELPINTKNKINELVSPLFQSNLVCSSSFSNKDASKNSAYSNLNNATNANSSSVSAHLTKAISTPSIVDKIKGSEVQRVRVTPKLSLNDEREEHYDNECIDKDCDDYELNNEDEQNDSNNYDKNDLLEQIVIEDKLISQLMNLPLQSSVSLNSDIKSILSEEKCGSNNQNGKSARLFDV